MKNMFILIFFFFLISFSFNKECSKDDCGSFNIEGETEEHYTCSPSDEDNCIWKLLCNYIVISDSDTNCSEKPVTDPTTYTCIQEGNTCKEIPFCENVILTLEDEYDIDCSIYPLKDSVDKEKKICVEDEIEGKCIEQYLCGDTPTTEGDEILDCYIYPVSPSKKYTHFCTYDEENENKCVEEQYECKDILRPKDGSRINCASYSTEKYLCLNDEAESYKACIEQKYCNYVEQIDLVNQPDCSYFLTSDPEKYYCKKSEDKNKCEEIYYCLEAPKDESNSCANFAVSEENADIYGCIEDTESLTNKCKEELYCELVNKTDNSDDDIICSKYPVKNKQTHVCVKNNNKEENNPCKEEKLCQYYTEETNDEECRKYLVTNQNTVCIKNPQSNTKGCVEKELCTTVKKGNNIDCSIYPVSEEKMKTHICKNINNNINSNTNACEEVLMDDIQCLKAERGENDERCSKYKVSNIEYKCIKNPSPIITKNYTICIEKKLSECELKTSGAIDNKECNKLEVEYIDKEKCVKNPNGNNCMLLTYCEYGEGNTDEDCAKYALRDEEKNECKKKLDENLCIEVEKIIEESYTSDVSDSDSVTDEETSFTESETISDTVETTIQQKVNNNDGNLIKISFSILMIIFYF